MNGKNTEQKLLRQERAPISRHSRRACWRRMVRGIFYVFLQAVDARCSWQLTCRTCRL